MAKSNTKITDYKIEEATSKEQLERYVKFLIRIGWEPLGGVNVTCKDDGWPHTYSQAMIKIKEGE